MNIIRRDFLHWGAATLTAGIAVPARAQPLDKLLRVTVTYAPGTATDTIARFVTEQVKAQVGGPVIVENRPGADGNIGAEAVARAGTDAYNVLVSGSSTHAANAAIYGKQLPYSPERDFSPLTTLATAPFFIVANPQRVRARTLAELVAAAKGGSLNFATSSVGGRVAAEKFLAMAGIKALHVPYVSSAKAMMDLLGGQIDFFFGDSVSAGPQVKAGKLTALAVTVSKRVASFPDVPTLAELGYEGFDVSAWIAAWSAASTPPEVSQRLASWFSAAIDSGAGRSFLSDRGFTPFPGTPEQLRALQARDTVEWGKAIHAAGLVRS